MMVATENSTYHLQRDNPHLEGVAALGDRFTIQTWLERIPGRNLLGTTYGIKQDQDPLAPPRPEVWEDPLLAQVYKMDIATFLIAEQHSLENTCKLVNLVPDERSKLFLATQVLDEARHFEVFSRRLADFGVPVSGRNKLMKRYTSPHMQKFFDRIDEEMDKNNFIGGIIGQNLILEGMAYPIYRYETKYWSIFDPGLSQIIKGAFADEVNHTQFGEVYLREFIQQDIAIKNKTQKMVQEFYQLMNDVFSHVIHHYVGLYQAAINEYMPLVGGIEIFPGKKMAEISEKEQTQCLLAEIQAEFQGRGGKIGLF